MPTDDVDISGFINVGDALTDRWPSFLPQLPEGSLLDHLWADALQVDADTNVVRASARLLLENEIVLSIPGLDAVAITIAASHGDTLLPVEVSVYPDFSVTLVKLPIALRLKTDLFLPAKLAAGASASAPPQWVVDTTVDHVDIQLAEVTISVNGDGDIAVDFEGAIDLPPCMIGSSGAVIEAHDIGLHLSADNPPPGQPPGWRGVHLGTASLYLPGELSGSVGTLALTDAYIGNGGFTGSVSATWTPSLSASLFGMAVTLARAEITFVQNTPENFELGGTATLPFFDQPVGVDLQVGIDGSIGMKVSAVQPPGATTSNGLLQFTKPDVLTMQLDSLAFAFADNVFTASLSGTLKPLVGGLDWPAFGVKQLSIDSQGNVKVDGGWIDLRDAAALDFYGFQIEITKIGFGKTDDGGKWIGFSGALHLVDGFAAGASVEGLKVTWYEDGSHDPKLTLEGVGVEFEAPNAVSFKGRVSFREFVDASGASVRQFDGDIRLKLLSLGMEVDAVLVIGAAALPDGSSYPFFAIYLGVELPAGIPLWSTGLGLYGLAGLFALQMEPDKHTDEEWYGVGPSDGWYKRPQIGVTDLAQKWRNQEASLALGGGLTIGTVADNGFTFNGRMLLVLVFPGPILMIEGKAGLLRERAKLSDEPIFRTLAVLDARAGTLLFGLDAQYKVGDGGDLLDIRGGAEAFFDFHDLDRWHLYLGLDEPREKRIRARLFSLFEANSYFMLDAHSLRIGAWVGYDKKWKYGPVKITIEAWLETNAMVNWKPIHFHGDLWAHGKFAMRVFGFGFGLALDAALAGDVFDPMHILAELSVELDLPWPLPNVDVDLTLEWGPQPTPPPIPMPLKEVAVEHLKVTTSWPLPRTSLLLPNFDNGGFIGGPSGPSAPGDLATAPVVPLDCRPHLTFGRPVHDAALIGANPQPPNPPYERIGDPGADQGPARVKYILKGVTLEKFAAGTWTAVARKADTANPPGLPQLYGSWAPVPGTLGGSTTQSVGQVKLWLWSKNPFDYTRNTSGAWDEWFTDNYPTYPCIPDAPGKQICCDFKRYRIGDSIDFPHICDPEMQIFGFPPKLVRVDRLRPPVDGIDRAACFLPESRMLVRFTRPARHVDIHLLGGPASTITCVDFSAHDLNRDTNPLPWQGLTLAVFNANGFSASATQFADLDGVRSLNVRFRTQINLPVASSQVVVTLVRKGPAMKVEAFDTQGQLVATGGVPDSADGPHVVALNGPSIAVVQVSAPGNEGFLQEVCFGTAANSDVFAVADFVDGTHSAPISPQDDHIVIDQEGIVLVTVRGRAKFCVIQVCADLGPDPEDVLIRQEMATHLQNSTAQWSQVGAVLEPNTVYRLKIETRAEAIGEGELNGWSDNRDLEEFAYFRTEGPPGLAALSPPAGIPDPSKFDSGLDDLTRYVKQTVPATVPPPGQKPLLPKPVYRAYDVGAEFNEDYVDLMYRISGRDLGLYLFDNNNLPVRDAAGRLIVRPNEWGSVEIVAFDATETRWIQTVNESTCAVISESVVPKDVKLSSGAVGQVLQPDAVYDARLIPLLVHESFARRSVGDTAAGPSGTLGRWQVVDQGTSQGPSQWTIAETPAPAMRYILQTTNIWGGAIDGVDPIKPGSMLIYGPDPNLPSGHADQPAQWTDYRLTAFVRNEDDDAIGLVFRYVDANNYYRFSMDAERRYRRLVRVINGIHTILTEDDRRYVKDVDYAVTVEAIGESLNVYLDGEPILSATDASHPSGTVGLYCWASQGARFFDIRVDDFRIGDAVAAYRFGFTTSKYAHFTHHVQAYEDKVWPVGLAPDVSLAAAIAAASAPNTPISDEEARAFDELAHTILGTSADGFPDPLEITRLERDGRSAGFLAQTGEPFNWSRIDLQMLVARQAFSRPVVAPDVMKMVSASFAASRPSEESVSLVTRDRLDLSGYAIDAFQVPGPIKASVEEDLFREDFAEEGHGLLFEETFGPNALDRYTIFDLGDTFAPSAWSAGGGAIRQSTNIAGGSLPAGDNAKPGTIAATGNPEWGSVRIRARLMSTDNDGIGIVFRFRDRDNYYRFSTDSERNYRRLAKCENGIFTTLWEDMTSSYTPLLAFDLQIDAYGSRLIGQWDGNVLFDVVDDAFPMGRVGLYSWLNTGALFQLLRVESLDADPVFAPANLTTLDRWTVVDPDGAVDGPSAWTPSPSGMTQTSRIRVEGADHIGAALLTGQMSDDLQFSVDLKSSEEGAMGVLVRYRDARNHYRFSMNRAENYRRLEKRVDGAVTVLWQAAAGFDLDRTYRLSVRARGQEIQAVLDGQILFTVSDGDHAQGSVGLYTWNNGGAAFLRALVLSLARAVGAFRVFDGVPGESTWSTRFGELRQRAAIGPAAFPHLGTHAVAPAEIDSDMRLTVAVRSESDAPIGVLFRYRDERNYYRLSASTADQVRRLIKMVDGVPTTLWEVAGGYSPGSLHRFVVDAFGDRLVGYLDGERLFEVRDSAHAEGRVGLYASRNDSVSFDLVRVSTPPVEAYALLVDKFAQSDASDWTFVTEATAGNPPNWVTDQGALVQTSDAHSTPDGSENIEKKGVFAVAGDPAWGDIVFRARLQSGSDQAIGVMFRYRDQDHYYRFSMDRAHEYRRLVKNVGGVFTELWKDEFLYETGRSYEVTIVAQGSQLWGYLDGAPMFAVEDSDLADGQVGLYCWRNPDSRFSCVAVLPIGAAFADWAFRDDFPPLVVDRWTFVDAGDTNVPSSWSVVGGTLTQTSPVSGDETWMGTYAMSEQGSRDWPDYRFTASVVSSTGTVGLAFRYRDPRNHYRFELDPGGLGSRLVKVVEGAQEELWGGQPGYAAGVPLLATVECLGQRIACYINGVQLCEVADDAFERGRIALFTFQNGSARFDFVRVQEAVWQTYYRFGKQPTVPAGYRIRILACSESDAPAPLPNVHDLFVAGTGEQGSVHFYDSHVDLRIRDPRGEIQHTRTFARSSLFEPVDDLRILRRRDGCGFLLIRPVSAEASRFAIGEHRLELTYRLDNRSVDAESQVQREAGISDPERTQIDL